jgi:hypothetical protein
LCDVRVSDGQGCPVVRVFDWSCEGSGFDPQCQQHRGASRPTPGNAL